MGNVFGRALTEESDLEERSPRVEVPRSREELNEFVTSEISSAGRAIEKKFNAYLDSADSRVSELDKRWRRHYKDLQKSYKELENYVRSQEAQREELARNVHYYQSLEKQLQEHQVMINHLNDTITAKDEEISKLKELTDPTREMRRKGHCIRPGDITHESVAKAYNELYTNRNLLKPIGITQKDERVQYVTKLLRCAYDCCKTSVHKMAEEEIAKLFEVPQHAYNEEEMKTSDLVSPWKSRQEALSLLLSLKAPLTLDVPSHLIDEVMEKQEEVAEMKGVVSHVTTLAWHMVTLSPPVTFGTPPVSHDMYELTDMDELLKDGASPGNYIYQYRRPVLFFGPFGTIGQKGSAAVLSQKMPIHDQETNAHDDKHKEVKKSSNVENDLSSDQEVNMSVMDKPNVNQTEAACKEKSNGQDDDTLTQESHEDGHKDLKGQNKHSSVKDDSTAQGNNKVDKSKTLTEHTDSDYSFD